jgi:hypothetical protein
VIGTVTIVGMAFSTGIAIFLVPVLFVLIERLSRGRASETAVAAASGLASVPLAAGGEGR